MSLKKYAGIARNNMKELVFFGSSLAGILRRNPYTSSPAEVEKFIKKHDKVVYERMFANISSEADKLQTVKRTNKDFMADIKEKANAHVKVKDMQSTREFIQSETLEKITTAKASLAQATQEKEASEVIAKSTVDRYIETLNEAQKKEIQGTRAVEDKLSKIAHMLCLEDAEKTQVDTIHKNLVMTKKKETSCKMDVEKCVMLDKEANTSINTNFGIRYENNTLGAFSERYGVAVSTPKNVFKRELYQDNDVKIILAGKIDGLIEGDNINGKPCLVEIKNRVKKFFPSLVEYEKVQIMTYMYILGLDQCFLVQTMKQDNTDIDAELYNLDTEWFDTFRNDLIEFSKGYVEFINDEEKQQEYMECALSAEKDEVLLACGM